MKKRIISLLMVISFMLGINVVSATDINAQQSKMQKIQINEYELIKELSSKQDEQLLKMGYSTTEIEKITAYHEVFGEHVSSLNQLDDSALAKHGYTQEQIEIIHRFNGSEEQLRALGATLTIYATPALFEFDGNYSRGRLAYNWYWDGVPAYLMRDAVAVAWNNWIVDSNTSYVMYYSAFTGDYYTQQSATYTEENCAPRGAGHKFVMNLSDNYYYAKRGGGTFDIHSDVHAKKDFYYYISYGHSVINYQISFTISASAIPVKGSIAFSTGVETVGSDKGEYIYT